MVHQTSLIRNGARRRKGGRFSKETALRHICKQYTVEIAYVFGDRAREVWQWLRDEETWLYHHGPHVDIGVKPSQNLTVRQNVELAVALEDLFGVYRVDLVSIPEVNPFLAASIIRGKCLYADDIQLANEYGSDILRRANDLLPQERDEATGGSASKNEQKRFRLKTLWQHLITERIF